MRKGTVSIALGLALLLGALGLTAYNFYDARRAEESAAHAAAQLEAVLPQTSVSSSASGLQTPQTGSFAQEEMIPDYLLDPTRAMPVAQIDNVGYIGVLRIPAISLELPVIEDWDTARLKLAPCRYVGSAYQNGFVIAGHNYKRHFGALKELCEGDSVTFTDMDGNVFSYVVSQIEILAPTAIDEMIEGDWPLTLFTCTLGGRSRVTVRCVAAEYNSIG